MNPNVELVANAELSSYTVFPHHDVGGDVRAQLGRVTRVKDRHWIAERFEAGEYHKIPDWDHRDRNLTTRRAAVAAIVDAAATKLLP